MNSFPFEDQRYAFSVCRIVPENNVDIILEAFAVDPVIPLVMVGNWNHSEYSRALRLRYQENPNIVLPNAIYNPVILNPLREKCTIYVHGHSCGGTNPSLVEAMYCGLPVIAFDVDFNRETTENQALYFKTPDELKDLCCSLIGEERRGEERRDKRIEEENKQRRESIGRKMKEIAERRYMWQRISDCYAKLF